VARLTWLAVVVLLVAVGVVAGSRREGATTYTAVPAPLLAASPAAVPGWITPLAQAEEMARSNPANADLALEAGSVAGDEGRYEIALRWFQKAAALDSRLLPARTGQGQMWMELGRPGRAAEAYEAALKLAPEEPELLLELTRAYTQLRDFQSALRHVRAAEKLQPESAEVQRALANVYGEILNPETSLAHATRACELGVDDPENWAGRGAILFRLRRYTEAQQDLYRALALAPAHVGANVLCAKALIEGKAPDADRKAFALLARARTVDPTYPEALLVQSQIATRAGQLPLAIGLLRQAREASPRDAAILLALGQTLVRSGKTEEGVRLVSDSQKLGPRGVAFLDLEELARTNPDPSITERLADLYRRQGLTDSAIRVLERGLKRRPASQRLRKKLQSIRNAAPI
jgi:tetratricopeptide (TPR) repeat protein